MVETYIEMVHWYALGEIGFDEEPTFNMFCPFLYFKNKFIVFLLDVFIEMLKLERAI